MDPSHAGIGGLREVAVFVEVLAENRDDDFTILQSQFL